MEVNQDIQFQFDFTIPASEIEVAQVVEISENVEVITVQDQNENSFPVSKKKFVCSVCTASFTRNLFLKRHVLSPLY